MGERGESVLGGGELGSGGVKAFAWPCLACVACLVRRVSCLRCGLWSCTAPRAIGNHIQTIIIHS